MRNRILATVALFIATSTACAAEFDIKNPAELAKIVPADAKVEKLADGFKFLEGPVWMNADGGFLIFSDIPNNKLMKWTKKDGISVFRAESRAGNGNTTDTEGRLVTCEEGARVLTRTEADGSVTLLADKYDGKRLNSPNDVAVKSDGTIWFTDPIYGLGKKPREQSGCYVFRLNPKTKELAIVAKDVTMPNGLCFSPDEKKLYISDSGKPRNIRVYEVKADGALGEGAVFCAIDKGGPDGIRCDADGRVWSSAGDGVHIFGTDGSLIGKILVPESTSNLCFGGADGKTLFMTGRTAVFAIQVNVTAPVKPGK